MTGFDLRSAIIEGLLAHLRSTGGISIAGAGCTGKSTLASELATLLRRSGVEAAVVDLDGYFMPRAERARLGFSAYRPEVFDLERARRDIERLLEGHRVPMRVYDKITGVPCDAGTLRLSDCLIIEGALALRAPVADLSPLRVFLDASLDTLFENRRRRERALGLDDESIVRKFEGLRADYEAYVAPQRASADLYIEVDGRYRFTKIETPMG